MKQKPPAMTRPFTINELQKIAYKLRKDLMNKEQETAFYDQPDNSDRNEAFDDYLDETTPPIMIAGIKIVPSNALYEADPDAYKVHAKHFERSKRIDRAEFLIYLKANKWMLSAEEQEELESLITKIQRDTL